MENEWKMKFQAEVSKKFDWEMFSNDWKARKLSTGSVWKGWKLGWN
jgi:hypothetical protein